MSNEEEPENSSWKKKGLSPEIRDNNDWRNKGLKSENIQLEEEE